MTTRPIAQDLFAETPRPHLIAGRSRTTGRIVFPFPEGLEGQDCDPVDLASEGTLWSWTVQRFRPKSPPYAGPEAFTPYAVGYVEFPGQVIVEGRLTEADFAALRIGERYRTVIVPFAEDADGTSILTYAFERVEGTAA
ncbi:Zn-ribbon domain-containing OB-fold protein [Rhizorhabdus dicambivorans]|uniref:DNA-binding protein n=1 Tax=Rhizorhabdus dicambivorans TaxID=1850238 RepID=A0A2A4FSM9_9SPHN|nr:OB-fold domain-containing protein [Rhizorhabdus dicambivorans]ATE66232.1 DNA-binding protein [Rhizorhabdus dicambivorans]PCE41745.1 DNA-binding protein [Rhizorhabdus dicambivorans]